MTPYDQAGMSALSACTIIAKNYLPFARVLAESWRQHHPDSPFFVLLLDDAQGYFDEGREPFKVVSVRDLAIPNLAGFLFKYTVLEASTAVKPYFLEHLFATHEVSKLLYLDPDILVLRPLTELSELLDSHSILLIPHITAPFPDDAKPHDHDILQSGTYNLGFLGVRNDAVAAQLFTWWKRKLYHDCVVDFSNNLFVDQRWMDLAPALLENVGVLRDPGYDIAYWNLHERNITIDGGEVRSNSRPCYFFHFSGFNPDEPSIISKHQDRFEMNDIGDAATLFRNYEQLLRAHGWDEAKKWPYTHDFFRNGLRIPASARRYYRSLGPHVEDLGDPFSWLDNVPFEVSDISFEMRGQRQRDLPFGVNVVGYVTSEKGVGEGVRSDLRILATTGIPHVANSFVDEGSTNQEPLPDNYSSEIPYSVNLIHVNADQIPRFFVRNPAYISGRYNIGYWAWELSRFPPEWERSFGYLDEIWAPSNFTTAAIQQLSPVPVVTIPHSIDPDLRLLPERTRGQFNVPDHVFVFMFFFDFHSLLERKNPLGLIRTFQAAFGTRKDVMLLLKSSHSSTHPTELRELRKAAGRANVQIMDAVLPRRATHSLMSVADCYVSLHRSEGFGLTIAEAMYCGKPVIATGYSGNVDFMTHENSFLIPYRLIEIDRDHGPYKAGYEWADPDFDRAVEVMRYVEKNRAAAAAVGERGRAHVSANLAPAAIGDQLRKRLDELGFAPSELHDSIPRT